MTNKMNIDMSDFFGGGAQPPQPSKKDVKTNSRFGFGMMSGKKAAASSSPIATKRSG